MKAAAFIVAFLLLLLAALACLAPASLLNGWIDSATGGHLRLAHATGTVWRGRGIVTDRQGTWALPVGWTLAPWSVVLREPAVALQAAEGSDTPRGAIGWRDAALNVDGVALTFSAAAFNGSLAPRDALAFGGYIAVDAPHVSWNGRGGGGSATAQWSGARVATAAGTFALGTVTVNVIPREGGLQGRVENRGGDVRVDGQFTVDNAAMNFDATIAPLPSAPPAVVRAIGALGNPDATGAVRLQWRRGGG